MTENIENMVLEHLKQFQVTLERVENKMSEMNNRVANLESGQASIMMHLAHFSAANAAQQVSTDLINNRRDRIERRLELAS